LGCAHEIVELEPAKTGTHVLGTIYRPVDSTPFEGVLVEVFTLPENAVPLWDYLTGDSDGKRISACVVEKNGKFEFRLKPGRYELRFSKSSEWNCTYLKIAVIGFEGKKLRVPMYIGN